MADEVLLREADRDHPLVETDDDQVEAMAEDRVEEALRDDDQVEADGFPDSTLTSHDLSTRQS